VVYGGVIGDFWWLGDFSAWCGFGIKWIKVARFWAVLVFFGIFGVVLRANFGEFGVGFRIFQSGCVRGNLCIF